MDFSELDLGTLADEGMVIELYHPVTRAPLLTDEKEKITVTVLGKYSDMYQSLQRKSNDRRLNQRGGGRLKISAAELEAEATDLLANCITAWFGIELDSKPLDCNYANSMLLLEDRRYGWFREQIDDAVADDGNFIKK